jgi:dCTP deaminase
MILTKKDIKQEMGAGNVVIRPFREEQLNPNSYDVRLGNFFYLLRYQGADPFYFGPVEVPDGEKLFLPAGETILAMTKEVIGANEDIVCQIRAKSSTRRMGISICDDAGLGDIGYVDHWTMELTANTRPYAVVTARQKIGQIVFYAAGIAQERQSLADQYTGQYIRPWPENMVPRKLESHTVPVGDYSDSPYVFWAISAQLPQQRQTTTYLSPGGGIQVV